MLWAQRVLQEVGDHALDQTLVPGDRTRNVSTVASGSLMTISSIARETVSGVRSSCDALATRR
jgi:hypothetical protein